MIDLNDASSQSERRSGRVPWKAIREAVKGRETEILDRLGIAWNSRDSHIHCPYPNHPDRNPSWRWDETDAKARCSCDGSASIFDVIIKMRGVDFPQACVIAAELIGRNDLIDAGDGWGDVYIERGGS